MDFDALHNYLKTPFGKNEVAIPEMPNLITYFDSTTVKQSFLNSPQLFNNKIKCVFAMAPAVGQGFIKKEQFSLVKVPVFIIDVEKDSIAPVITNAIHYSKLIKTSTLKILKGDAGHYVFLNTANSQLKHQAPLYFTDAPSVNREEIHKEVLNEAMKFFDKYFK